MRLGGRTATFANMARHDAAEFGSTSTTDEVLAGVDLGEHVIAVTGASGGLGLETARAFAGRGARVVMAARDADKLAAAIAEVRRAEPDAIVEPLELDLADVRSCRRAAASILRSCDRLDLVVNNAGVMCTPFGLTADGVETQFGVNHLGHMAWTLPLIDLLTASADDGRPARVVSLSSAGHKFGDVDLDDPNFETRSYDPWEAFGRSKTANVLFSVALGRRHGAAGVRGVAVHPGGIHTELGRYMTGETLTRLASIVQAGEESGEFTWKSVPQGAATTVWAATTPSLTERAGVYCEDCHVAPVDDDSELNGGGVRSYAVDPARADLLWERSLELLDTIAGP